MTRSTIVRRTILSGTSVLAGASLLFSLACSSGTSPQGPEEPLKDTTPGAKKAVDPRYQALPTPGTPPDFDPPAVQVTTLNNGLSLWHMHQETTPLVSIHLMLATGGQTDPEGKAGLSLLTADILDEGAGKYSALELSDHLGELATDYSVTGGVDYVMLTMESLSENLDASLAALADIVQRPRLTKDEFDRRKKHYVATALAERDDPSSSRSNAVAHALFGTGYASQPAAGIVKSLESITYQDVKAHAKRLTVPEGAHLAIAGLSNFEEARALTEKHFAGWKGKLSSAEPTVERPSFEKKAFVVDYDEAAQSALAVVTRAGDDSDKNYFAEEVMNDKLGASFTSRINMNLREDKGYTYGAGSVFRRFRKAGMFGIYSNVKSEVTGASVREIFSELSALCAARPLTEVERNEAVEGLLLGYPMQFDEVGSMGLRLITLPARQRPADFWQTWPENMAAITTARANEAARPYCDPSKYAVVVAGDLDLVASELSKLGLTIVEMDRDGQVREAPAESVPKK